VEQGGSRGSVESFFGGLCKGSSAHLAPEERFMRERGYDRSPRTGAIMSDCLMKSATTIALAGRLEAWF
jgi:hypothetical protein